MNKQELLNKLTSSEELIKTAFVPVSEVINWVNELDENGIDLEELTEQIVGEITSEGLDLIEDYDLEMNYREVELTNVEIDENKVKRAIERAISDYTSK